MRVHDSITDLDAPEWDSIVGDNRFICRHAYLAAVEASAINECRYWYPAVYRAGRIVAHTCVYSITSELDTFAQGWAASLVRRVRTRWPRFLTFRSLECGTPVATGNTISFGADVDRPAAFLGLLAAIEELAAAEGIHGLLFRDFREQELGLYDLLLGRGYTRTPNLPGCRLELRWRDFDEYLGALRHPYRHRIMKHARKLDPEEVTAELVTEFGHLAPDLQRLWQNVYDRAAEYRRERLTEAFFRNMDQTLGPRSAVLLLKQGERPVAFALLLFEEQAVLWLFCGLDYSCNERYSLYFNLLSEIVRLGLARDARAVDLGITTLTAKKAMGGRVVPLHIYMKHTQPVWNWLAPRLFRMMTPEDATPGRRVFK